MPRLFRVISFTLLALIITSIPCVALSAAGQDMWGEAHGYMIDELIEAQSDGLIPAILDGADFTKPITRVEFAQLIVLLCETYTGVSTIPSSPNRFTDTDDECAFKAYGFGIMEGTDGQGTLFSPDKTIDRETMAFMFYRAIRVMAPLADYYVSREPDIPDIARISEIARPAVSFLYSRGIIVGTGSSRFMPRPVTASQIGSNYGIATREQCVVIAKRLYKELPGISGSRFRIEDKAAEVLSYAKDEPQAGLELSRDELADILRPYIARVRWADNMVATSYLGDYRKVGDGQWGQGYDSAFTYNVFSAKGPSQYKYDEEQMLMGAGAGQSRFALNIFDADLHTISTYYWDSETDTGEKYGAPLDHANFFSPLSLTAYMPSRLNWTYKLFDDEVVAGEVCKVFSVTRMEESIQGDESTHGDEPPGLTSRLRDVPPSSPESPESPGSPPSVEREVTEYFYISTVSGLCLVQKNYSTLRDTTYQAIMIVFSISPSLVDAGAISPPSGIEFIAA